VRGRRCCRARREREGGGSRVAAVGSVAGGRDDVEGETEALSFNVIRLCRSLLPGMASKVFPLAICLPFLINLVPGDTLEVATQVEMGSKE